MLFQNVLKEKIAEIIKEKFGVEIARENINIEIPKSFDYGDLCTTAPMNLAKALKMSPLKIAEILKECLEKNLTEKVKSIEILPPGFVNFRLSPEAHAEILKTLNSHENLIAQSEDKSKILLEFVSANPTGDLHLGHGRGAVLGSCIANVLKAVGRKVLTEFYINDAGEQIDKLGRSAWGVYKNLPASEDEYPKELIAPYVNNTEINKENKENKESELSQDELTKIVKDRILTKQKNILERLGVSFDKWVSEKKELHENGALAQTLKDLEKNALVYENEGAIWLKSKELGDERDRVLIKSNGNRPTYLMGDLAYHRDKFARADELLNLWGADHFGQDVSLKLGLKALGLPSEKLNVLFLQLVSLLENGQEVKMSKRKGTVITVEEVLDEVGKSAFRAAMLMSNSNNRLIFDVDLAKRADDQNPVFYLQYAHARACSIVRKAESDLSFENTEKTQEINAKDAFLEELPEKELKASKELLIKLSFFSQEVHNSAKTLNPCSVMNYLLELASMFHSFYNVPCKVVDEMNIKLSLARLSLVSAFRKVLKTGLDMLGIDAPEKM